MSVSAVTGTSSTSTTSSSTSIGELGKDDFLRLLLAQMQNQDPLNPMDDTAFMTQLVQFSTLESMQHMDEHISTLLSVEQLSQAESMVGKQVSGTVTTDGTTETIEGVVDSVKMVDGSPVLVMGDKSLKLSDVTKVVPKQKNSSDIALASNMIGMQVEANTTRVPASNCAISSSASLPSSVEGTAGVLLPSPAQGAGATVCRPVRAPRMESKLGPLVFPAPACPPVWALETCTSGVAAAAISNSSYLLYPLPSLTASRIRPSRAFSS
ncbi:MAG TPA: flagellar hook capping FlgD N-terminal domain-containing protein [Chloroflexota bacterium]|nr:flagellar hook capping FlgD N-terminal domain-containing protein [Chloroflexota bacterium]